MRRAERVTAKSEIHIGFTDDHHITFHTPLYSPALILYIQPSDMADPTKAETEQVFKILKAQKANKVRVEP